MEQKKSHALNRSSPFRQNAKHAKMLWMIDWRSAVCMIAFALQICPRWLRTAPPTRVLTRLSCACQVICYHRFIISKSHPCIIIFHQRRHDLTITITDVGLPYCSCTWQQIPFNLPKRHHHYIIIVFVYISSTKKWPMGPRSFICTMFPPAHMEQPPRFCGRLCFTAPSTRSANENVWPKQTKMVRSKTNPVIRS